MIMFLMVLMGVEKVISSGPWGRNVEQITQTSITRADQNDEYVNFLSKYICTLYENTKLQKNIKVRE